MKKILSVALAMFFLISVCATGASADGEKLNYVLLGDSIAHGAGVLNPDEACYGRMVANTNGYNYFNDSVSGHRSENLISRLENSKVAEDIKNADIISISIGGNDYLKSNFVALFFCSFFDYEAPFVEIQKKFYDNFSTIIGKIKQLNPDALILVQTVYNMRLDLITPANEIASKLLNEVYSDYLEANPGSYVIVDVASALHGRADCLALDTIHPNGKGNRIIAQCVLEVLKAEGLGSATEPVILEEPIEQYQFALIPIIKLFR